MDFPLILESLVYIVKMLYFLIEGMIYACLPASLCWKKNVRGEKVLITGAGSGLGRLMSQRFAELGCSLILWDINTEGNEGTAELVREKGAEVHTYTVDLSNREDIYKAAGKVKADVGDVDILVNNAGIVTGKKFMQSPDSLIDKTLAVNTSALFWTTKSFLPAMLEKNHGHIVNISSSAGLFGIAGLADYSASKFGTVGFDEALTNEFEVLGKTGVRTTLVCPFFINTGMFDGVTTRFPLLMPIVEPEYAVQKIVEAVLTNQDVLCIPRSIYLFYFLKGFLPEKASKASMFFFGVNNGMDDFRGRSVKTE